jgi:hypothetical protein
VVCKLSTTPSGCTSGDKGVVCMKWKESSPTSCSEYWPDSYNHDTTWTMYRCTSGATSFGGDRRCSKTSGTYATQGNPSSTSGEYCWCRLTSPAASAWVFLSTINNSTDDCLYYCAYKCGREVMYYPDFRSVLFNAIGQ